MGHESAEANQHGDHEDHWLSADLIRHAGPNSRLQTEANLIARRSASGQNRKSSVGLGMSVVEGEADVIGRKADIAS